MSRSFAIIPAAGHSLRMGRPKLLLERAGRPLIRHTVDAWLQSCIERVFAVVRLDDDALAIALNQVSDERLQLVRPATPPPDMKASIQAALRHIERTCQPDREAAFLIAPADMPDLSPAIVAALLMRHRADPERILVPTLAGKQGHPVLFPWTLAERVHLLAAEEGVNAIVQRNPPLAVACDDLVGGRGDPFADVDTPDQYRRWAGE
jgi:molybdenum cofactor cytidylyltransferase